jgi:ATP-dependent 26S proteasome regulatory subunit
MAGLGNEGTGDDAACTNDLGEAARRAEASAQRQFRESQAAQQQPKTPQMVQEEEEQRQRRAQQQQIELQKHQAAMEQAAAARAMEEARQREELVARMSPADLARAAEVHAQQQAVGAHAFGSQPASQVAGLVHQSHVHEVAREAAQHGDGTDEEFLMSLSPEEFAQWDRSRQGADNGAVPW